MLSSCKREDLEFAAERYIDSLTTLNDVEKEELKMRCVCHAVFVECWTELREYIDKKEVEIILNGKLKPEPRALDFGSWE